MRFIHYTQHDAMDCGPTCLRMVARHYGRQWSLETLRQRCYITRWQGQPGYVPVEQCGTFTPEGFVPDGERIERVLRGTAGE